MAKRNSLSGGFFLMLAILGGLVLGTLSGEPSMGVIAGTALGIVVAVILYIVDRRRG